MTAVVDIRIPKAAEAALATHGFSVVKLPPHPVLPRPVASHPDMLVFFAHDAIFCTRSYFEIAQKELETISARYQKPIRLVSDEVGSVYPRDILLNAAPLGDKLICHPKHTARELTALCEVVPVKQGYAKCSTVILGSRAIITEDASIAQAAEQHGIDVLRIFPNAVHLEGYDTGFLGGAASLAPYGGTDNIYFCGDLNSHPNAREIQLFCKQHGFSAVSLSNEPLTDIGPIFLS